MAPINQKPRRIGSREITQFDLKSQKTVYELDYGRELKMDSSSDCDEFRLRSISGIPDDHLLFLTAEFSSDKFQHADFKKKRLKVKHISVLLLKGGKTAPYF
tara:strand:- start:783 stop:1088 length:306 start_codon:yes stop_codon:yes gene_type:complete